MYCSIEDCQSDEPFRHNLNLHLVFLCLLKMADRRKRIFRVFAIRVSSYCEHFCEINCCRHDPAPTSCRLLKQKSKWHFYFYCRSGCRDDFVVVPIFMNLFLVIFTFLFFLFSWACHVGKTGICYQNGWGGTVDDYANWSLSKNVLSFRWLKKALGQLL